MDHIPLVRQAAAGDVPAFVELTRRFQNFAFGSALALVGDFQRAEDVVQEAFLSAWRGLPTLQDPAAFPGWLRGIVRHHAFRVLRRSESAPLPLDAAADLPDVVPATDDRLDERQRAAVALAALSHLPPDLREPATLFFVHECSYQDIATFLDLPLSTVNNRVHQARTHLKRRILAMVSDSIHSHALPDSFAHRIGRLVEARGNLVEVLFDPDVTPDLLSELTLSDQAQRRGVSVQVTQRPAPGVVRGVMSSPAEDLPRGSTVLAEGRRSLFGLDAQEFASIVDAVVPGRSPAAEPVLLRTGIKPIDVICPLVAGGTLAIAGEMGAGTTVVMRELVHRLKAGPHRLTIFVFMPAPTAEYPPALEPGYSLAAELHNEAGNEGTVGAVQTFFLASGEGGWTPEKLAVLAPVDTVIRLSRARGRARVYPTIDVADSHSRLLQANATGTHAALAVRVREALVRLWANPLGARSEDRELQRALKLQNYFTQPFETTVAFTGRPGTSVAPDEALQTCRDILDGRYDHLPVEDFFFSGGMDEILGNHGRTLKFGPVDPTAGSAAA